MVDAARRAILAIDSSIQECREHSDLKQGKVMVAVGHVTAATLLPHILLEFRQRHPQLDLIVVDCMVQQIRTRAVLARGRRRPGRGHARRRLPHHGGTTLGQRCRALRAHRPPAGPARRGRRQSPCRVALYPAEPGSARLAQHQPPAGSPPTSIRAWSSASLLFTAIGLIQAGMGVAMLPQISGARCPPASAHRVAQSGAGMAHLHCAAGNNYPLSPAAQAFVAVVRSVSQRLRREAAMP